MPSQGFDESGWDGDFAHFVFEDCVKEVLSWHFHEQTVIAKQELQLLGFKVLLKERFSELFTFFVCVGVGLDFEHAINVSIKDAILLVEFSVGESNMIAIFSHLHCV